VHFATTRRYICKYVTSFSFKIHVAPFINNGMYMYPCKVVTIHVATCHINSVLSIT